MEIEVPARPEMRFKSAAGVHLPSRYISRADKRVSLAAQRN
jgi:hypothetical protein